MTSNAAMRVAGYFVRPDDATDADLLQRFVAERDGEAFAALVRRHGPMVFGVCRRVLGDWHLAEDAFQAAFVVLARKAAAVSPPGAVAGWLHGVALRVAKDARRSALRRFNRERPTDMLPESPAQPTSDDTDFEGVLDDELQKLPGKYRQLLVACDLEGRPRQPVAESLGIPEGTLSSRLTTARKMLANRLAKRGIAPAIVASVAASGPSVVAREVPRVLLASTARIGSDVSGTVPAAVVTLANGAIRVMTITKFKFAGFVLVAVALVAAGAVYASGIANAPPANRPDPPRFAAPQLEEKTLPVGPNKLLFFRAGQLTFIDPDGKNEQTVSRERGLFQPENARLSPDGKSVAVVITMHIPNDPLPGEEPPKMLHVRGLDEKEPGTNLGVECKASEWSGFAWSPDGTEIAYTGPGEAKPGAKGRPTVHGIINVKTKVKTPLKLPADDSISDWSRDGKYFLTYRSGVSTLHLMNRDGTEHKALTDAKDLSAFGRFSPDGKRVLYMVLLSKNPRPFGTEHNLSDAFDLVVLDLATMKREIVANVPARGDPSGFCWSPDGKRIAYTWREIPRVKLAEMKDTVSETRLIVCDPGGKNAKTIATEKAKGLLSTAKGDIDWR